VAALWVRSRCPAWSAVERSLRGGSGEGRAAPSLLALPGTAERIHLRPVHHGGWLAQLWRGAIWGPGRPAAELRATARLLEAGAPPPPAPPVGGRRAPRPARAALGGHARATSRRA